jgi:phosphate transport system substrate-binding protein
MFKKLIIAAAAVLVSSGAYARDYISIVGSSTVFPFSTAVAESLGGTGAYPTPVIESTGSGGGMKLFCKGNGMDTPDVTNSSRAIKSKEAAMCAENGVTPIEYLIGYDGITFSNSKDGQQLSLTKEDIFNAVSENVYDNGTWVPNPNQVWSDVRADLPNIPINIMAPPPTSGTRDAFVELVMHGYCKKQLGLDKKTYKANCTRLRIDGPVVEVGENDNLIIQKLQDDDTRFGIFGFSFLDQNADTVQPALVDGVAPSFDSIADGSYAVSRPLFYYVKKEHIGVVPGLEDYSKLFKKMAAPEGPLEDMGLIPLK